MDPLSIISHFIKEFWFVFPIGIIIIRFLKTPWFKGMFGEAIVSFLAWLRLDKNIYHRINNVTLPAENGTTQVDHIIVTIYGEFVVETKNMKGWIFGSREQKTWTQKIFRHTEKFQNPLHQNYKHVKTLQSILGLEDNQIHSVVVFIGDSTFKTDMPENVIYGMGYIRYIKSKTQLFLSETKVLELKDQIENIRLERSFETSRAHIAKIKNIVEEKKNKGTPECPRCGGEMVLREVKKGSNVGNKFWGCVRVPRCKGTIKMNYL